MTCHGFKQQPRFGHGVFHAMRVLQLIQEKKVFLSAQEVEVVSYMAVFIGYGLRVRPQVELSQISKYINQLVQVYSSNMALNLEPFGRWTLHDKAAQRRLVLH